MFKWRIVIVSVLTAIAVSQLGWTVCPLFAQEKGKVSQKDPGSAALSRIEGLSVGQRQEFGGLTVFPITGGSIGGINYLTFDDAMRKGVLIVSEKGSGEVNMVCVRNKSSQPVFVMDGEEIVGARQNRIVNSSVMIPTDRLVEPAGELRGTRPLDRRLDAVQSRRDPAFCQRPAGER